MPDQVGSLPAPHFCRVCHQDRIGQQGRDQAITLPVLHLSPFPTPSPHNPKQESASSGPSEKTEEIEERHAAVPVTCGQHSSIVHAA